MFKKLICILLLMITSIALHAEPIKTSLNQKVVGLNESFSLVYSTKEKIGENPDFSPLQADFEIVSTTQGSNISIINGKADQETRWNLILMPKKEGKLTIPAIRFGQYYSQPEEIEIRLSPPTTQQMEQIILETEFKPKTPIYEQTQLIFIIRLLVSVNITQASLSELKVNDPDAIIEKLGNDIEYEKYHANGKLYKVFERKYAVFPQKAGELIFSPVVFEGRVIMGNGSFFDIQKQFKRLSSQEQKVTVKPIPSPFERNHWFAAQDVTLTGEWSSDPSHVTLGEPITWTVTVTANGCLGNQIPEIPLHLPAGLRQYPDKPQVSHEQQEDSFVGCKKTKMVLIPSKAGEMTVPEISLKWWDLKTNQVREAKIPSTTLQIHDSQVALAPIPEPLPQKEPEIQPNVVLTNQPLPLWVWYLVAFNFLCIPILAIFFWKKRKPNPLKEAKLKLKQACQSDDPKQAEKALLTWGSLLYPQEKPINLIKIKKHLPQDLQNALEDLYASLYSQQMNWNGQPLWQSFSKFNPKRKPESNPKGELLRTLYPNEG